MEKKKMRLLACIIITCVIFAGCGKSSNSVTSANQAYDAGGYDTAAYATETAAASATDMIYEYDVEEAVEDISYEQETGESSTETVQTSERKLIKTVDLNVETETYDDLFVNLERQIEELGGYIEYQYQYNGSYYNPYDDNRSARLTVRIPVERLDEFVVKVGEQTNITNKEERVEDVTLQYVDLESRKKALSTEQDRLLELLEKAETVEDIISIEQRLSEVRYELESMESRLRTLMNQVNYSTINLNIQEVKRLTPTEEKTAWDRIKNGFVKSIYQIGESIENGFIRFMINIPYLIVWILLLGAAFLVIRFIFRKMKPFRMSVRQKTADRTRKLVRGIQGRKKEKQKTESKGETEDADKKEETHETEIK